MGFSLGDAISVGATVFGAFSDKDAGDENRRISEDQAARERLRTELELKRQRREHRRLEGSQRTQFAAAGVRIGGSALDILADSAAENILDIKLIEAGGSLRENLALSRGRLAEQQGDRRFIGGIASATAKLVDEL